jgi:hypothetical protein
MAKIKNTRKTKRNRKGDSKRRKPRNKTAKGGDEITEPEVPHEVEPDESEPEADKCGICLEDMVIMRTTKKTKCGHRFHKECLHQWCKSRKQQGVKTRCPMCNADIEKDCTSLVPGQPMPEHRIRDILFSEDFEAHKRGATGSESEERRKRMKEFLEELQFPKRFKYDEWNKITNLRLACDAAINCEEVRNLMASKYGT